MAAGTRLPGLADFCAGQQVISPAPLLIVGHTPRTSTLAAVLPLSISFGFAPSWRALETSQSRRARLNWTVKPHASAADCLVIAAAGGDGADQQTEAVRGSPRHKYMWLRAESKMAFTAAVEAGVQHFVFPDSLAGQALREEWGQIAAIPQGLLQQTVVSDGAGSMIVNGDDVGDAGPVTDDVSWKFAPSECPGCTFE